MTTASYSYGGFSCTTSALAFQTGGASVAFGRVGYALTGANLRNVMVFDVTAPQIAAYTRVISNVNYGAVGAQYTSVYSATTSFDGIKLIPLTVGTTLTGAVKIYGYN